MSLDALKHQRRPNQTKIVATVGPACGGHEGLVGLIRAGVDVFRVNTAHGSREEHRQRVDEIRDAAREVGVPTAVLVDLAGPKMRLGELPGGRLDLARDALVRFVRGESSATPNELVTTYAPLVDELEVGDRVMLADGTVVLLVEEKSAESATCRVTQPGVVRSRQGVNLPGAKLSAPALGDADRSNAVWAASQGVDFISLSFVRSADDVRRLKSLLEDEGADAQVIAKIEKPEALEEIEAIVQAADGVMIARGDLGVEIPISEVPVVQKRIIELCRRFYKPVIVATQMLDSMQRSRLPTRAEATDVANAILDGADACMLSGETAIGEYPREAVEMMHEIASATEPLVRSRASQNGPRLDHQGVSPITEAVAFYAGQLAEALNAKALVVATASGGSARSLSSNRFLLPTIGLSRSDATLRRLCLYWGVIPVPGLPDGGRSELVEFAVERGRRAGYFATGDRIVVLSGTDVEGLRHNEINVHEIR